MRLMPSPMRAVGQV